MPELKKAIISRQVQFTKIEISEKRYGVHYLESSRCCEKGGTKDKAIGSTLKQFPKTMDVLLMKLLSNNLEPWRERSN
jgi:hypothetical protein